MMKRIRFLAYALVVLTFASGMIAAQQLTSRPEAGRNNREDGIARRLGLTQEQRLQVREVNRRTRLALRQAQQRFRQSKAELNEAIYGETVSEEDLRAKIKAVVEAQAEITKTQALREFAVRRILTPEQLTKFRRLREQAAERRRKRMKSNPRNRRLRRNNQRARPINQP